MIKNDIEMAKEILFKEKLNICIVKDGKIIFKSIKRGIYPMYMAVESCFDELEGASVADRIIGRAAALLNVYSKVLNVYSDIISKNAVEILNKNNINISYNISVHNIKNREKNDLCPIEKLSLKIKDEDYKKLIEEIKIFLISIKAI